MTALPTDTALRDAGAHQDLQRRYFLAGTAAALTVGAGWGVWLLWQIGMAGSFTSVSIHAVNAHGHAQIFGWVALFIMGAGYTTIPRLWSAPLVAPRYAAVALGLMVLGLLVRTPAMALHDQPWALSAVLVGGMAQLLAIGCFVGQLALTWHRSDTRLDTATGFIFAGLACFMVQGVVSLWHTTMTMTADTREQLLWQVATYQAVLRDLQIHGLALLMILGVSLRLLPAFFRLPSIPPRRAWAALTLILLGVVGESLLFVAYRWTGNHGLAGAMLLAWLMLAVGSLILPWSWRLWRPLPVADRSSKFVRAAYGWLALSMVMLLLLPVYQILSGIAFSHAYYGAIRHAITVGFISLMIMGMGARFAASHRGGSTGRLPSLLGPFVLVNLGCLLRVALQTLTDWHAGFFVAVGVSGLLELAGLAWWGLYLARSLCPARPCGGGPVGASSAVM